MSDSFPTVAERMSAWRSRLVEEVRADPGRAVEATVSALAVVLGTALILAALHPSDLWKDTTATGGDMGAHVWGPRYLLDELLPNLRLSGWSPDWYNGFPAYQFYMVVPSLMIVALHVGLDGFLWVPVVLGALAAGYLSWSRPDLYRYRRIVMAAAVTVSVLSVPIAYNRSFKLVTALGLLAVPIVCWAFAKLADLPFPIPPLASVAGLVFVFNREPVFNNTGNIIGGNFSSTMAGEFAFSISLTVAILYLGVAARGLRTGRYRALAAGLFALAGLCHLIPAFFVLACTAAMFLVHPDRARLKWLSTMVPVAGLLTAFWVLPFWWRRDFVNDMGWEKLPAPGANAGEEAQRIAGDQASAVYYLFPSGMRLLMLAALVGVLVSFVRRYSVGMVLTFAWVGAAIGFVALPQYRLWNARILPFLYLSVALLAAIGVGELIRFAGAVANGRAQRPLRPITVAASSIAVFGVLLYVTLPLTDILEGPITRSQVPVTELDGTRGSRTRSSWFVFDTLATNPVPGWSAWNYSGLEEKDAQPEGCDADGSTVTCTSGGWPEYRDLMATMARLGADAEFGCGRAFWEYDDVRINGYGTPMAPMLLPYWTDGCIGSQEGLYFESSATVPYHFLMQSELSAEPSTPQRELPYPAFDMATGVRHLQLLGVKYFLAMSDQAVAAASADPDLTEVAVSGPWHIYLVADAPTVAPLAYEPVVASGMGESQQDWLPTATAWFLDPKRLDVPLAQDGPDGWERVEVDPVPEEWRRIVRYTREQLGLPAMMDQLPDEPRTRLPANEVTDIESTNDSLSFTVSKPGVPVLVKTSYFPNWQVTGAEGPYRVTPNLMVVVPTTTHVTMTFGRTPVDLVGAGLSILGVIGLVLLARRPAVAIPAQRPGRLSQRLDDLVSFTSSRRGREQPAGPDGSAGSGDVVARVDADPDLGSDLDPAEVTSPSPSAGWGPTGGATDGDGGDDGIWYVEPPAGPEDRP